MRKTLLLGALGLLAAAACGSGANDSNDPSDGDEGDGDGETGGTSSEGDGDGEIGGTDVGTGGIKNSGGASSGGNGSGAGGNLGGFGGVGAGGADTGGTGGLDPGGTGGEDAGGTGGGPPLDPTSCPVGETDGCCPLAIRGGTDPDCSNLACTLEVSEPILLTDEPVGYDGGTGIYWTGEHLILGSVAKLLDTGNDYHLRIERRDEAGALIEEELHLEFATTTLGRLGTGYITYEPNSGTFLYVYNQSILAHLFAFDDDLQKLWSKRNALSSCRQHNADLKVFASKERFYLAADSYGCSGTGHHSRVQAYELDGSLPDDWQAVALRSYSTDGAYACNGDCSQIYVYFYDSGTRVRTVNTTTGTMGAEDTIGGSLYGGVNGSAMVWNGDRYFVASHDYIGPGYSATRFFFYDPVQDETTAFTDTEAIATQGAASSMVWTGGGYVLAMGMYDFQSTSPNHDELRIHIRHIDATGTVQQSFYLDENVGYDPQLVVMDGKVALTWSRADGRYLAFLSCSDPAP